MFTQKFIKIFYSVQEIGLFSLFQNLNLGNASANPKWYLTISWATSCQYQCVCKILSNIPNGLRVIDIFFTNRPGTKSSQTGRGQNLHKLSGDKIKCLIIGHSMKFNFQFQLTFLWSCNRSLKKRCNDLVCHVCLQVTIHYFVAHLSRRLTRWAYSIPMVRRRPSLSSLDQILYVASLGWFKRLGQIRSKLWFRWQYKAPIDL